MPALQGIFQGHAALKNNIAVVKVLEEEITNYSNKTKTQLDDSLDESQDLSRLSLSDRIRFEKICFSYPGSKSAALNELTLEIQAKSSVAFVGTSGAGKTTCIDLLLGLIEPESGKILVDDIEVKRSNVRQWQNNIGYVPQNIYLADTTIARNIAFGIDKDQIDIEAVENAAKMASLDDFIKYDLSDGYQTLIGEHGIKLSGGQKQRIGIARALYHNPDVLVLDEATSALDTPTEQAIMESIHKLLGQKTVIIIAHRISSIRECSMIFRMENGSLLESGSYEELIDRSESFRRLAKSYKASSRPKK